MHFFSPFSFFFSAPSALPSGPTAAASGGPVAGGALMTVTQQIQDVSGGSCAPAAAPTAAVLVQQGEGTTGLALM